MELHAFGRFDASTRRLLGVAQAEAERRGGSFLVSGLIMLAAASKGDLFSAKLLNAMGTDLSGLVAAVDAEWSDRSRYLQDQPVTLVNEAINSTVAATPPNLHPSIETLLAATLGFDDSMASRVVRRLGVEPSSVATELNNREPAAD
jgi:hypothetical protein